MTPTYVKVVPTPYVVNLVESLITPEWARAS
jgi:hypothetical protein